MKNKTGSAMLTEIKVDHTFIFELYYIAIASQSIY